jgi:hypothetical protein
VQHAERNATTAGSGSAALLELARVIHATGAAFEHTLRLCLFTGASLNTPRSARY